jgi:tetratricopeptide (TPR) repeat protein
VRQITEIIKSEFTKYKDSVQVISGFITVSIAIISLISKVFESKYAIALCLCGLFLIIQRVCKEIIYSKKESFGIVIQTHSIESRSVAKIVKYLSWLLWLFPIYMLLNLVFLKKENCISQGTQFGILITSFTTSNNDDFSYKLFSLLESDLQGADSIKTLQTDNFVSPGKTNFTDTIKNTFSKNCLDHGLLVFGKRSDQSRLFDCNIFINNVYRLNIDSSKINDKGIIFLRNPYVVNFSIDSQANIVSDFIIGLLYYNSGNFESSKQRFKRAIGHSPVEQNTKFKSYCHLFIGNNLIKESKITEAVGYYKSGILYDSLNAFLHYNLAVALLIDLDSSSAFQEYEIANKLNSAFLNPLDHFFRPVKKEIITSGLGKKDNQKNSDKDLGKSSDTLIRNVLNKNVVGLNKEFSVVNQGGKYGIINMQGKIIVPCEFNYISDTLFNYLGYKYFMVQRNGKFGAVSKKGILEVPTIHPSADYVKAILKVSIDYDPPSVNH